MSNPLKSVHIWNAEESAGTNARSILPQMLREYFARGRNAVDAETPASKLHPFRLATKRIRYTLEGFREIYGEQMDQYLGMLKPVQDALGDVNDCVATKAQFKAGKAFKDFLKDRAEKKAQDFYNAWRNKFDAPGQEARWIDFLSQLEPAGHSEDLTGHEAGSR